MSDTYIGWDGKPYPWPPPDGWYHASDGRWWAPNTGPNPPQAQAQATGVLPTPGPAEAPSALASRTAEYPQFTNPGPEAGPSALGNGPDTGQRSALGGDGYAPPSQQGSGPYIPAGYNQQPAYNEQPGYNQPDEGYDIAGFQPTGAPAPAEGSGGGSRRLLAIVGAVVAVVAIGAVAFLTLRGGNDDVAAGTGTTTAPTDGSTSITATGDTTASSLDDGTGTTATSTDPAAPTGSVDDSGTTLAPQATELVTGFRDLLIQNGLTSDLLNDAEIQTFGSTFCIFAGQSDTAEDFGVFRDQAIAETTSNLSPEALNTVIDAAILTFCPDEAGRLNIVL